MPPIHRIKALNWSAVAWLDRNNGTATVMLRHGRGSVGWSVSLRLQAKAYGPETLSSAETLSGWTCSIALTRLRSTDG